MSNFVLKDGKTGNTAEVDVDNRLQTSANTETESTFAAFNGNLYNINTDTINLTTANASALLFMQNTDDRDWVLTRVFYNAEVSTGGSGKFLAEVLANPTAGTLISAGVATSIKRKPVSSRSPSRRVRIRTARLKPVSSPGSTTRGSISASSSSAIGLMEYSKTSSPTDMPGLSSFRRN